MDLALLYAAKGTGCAGVGREPHDCPNNPNYFTDSGFHDDYQDGHNQLFHLWAYIATTASPGNIFSSTIGGGIGYFGNYIHEIAQSNLAFFGRLVGSEYMMKKGWGTSWQDYTLSIIGMEIGRSFSNGEIGPSELSNYILNIVGTNGPGSNGLLQERQNRRGPLFGSPN